MLAAGLFHFGFIVENLLSAPVLSGFTQGAAILIIMSQLKHVLGISATKLRRSRRSCLDTISLGIPGNAETIQELLHGVFSKFLSINWFALIMGVRPLSAAAAACVA